MRDRFNEFLKAPSVETYLAVREALIASDGYQPYSNEFDTAGQLYEEGKLSEACGVMERAMSNLLLSPRAHRMLSFLYFKEGNEEAAGMEYAIAESCLQGILATGEGSLEKPFLVVRTSDEYDVLEHFDKKLAQQSLRGGDSKRFDVISCVDGTEYVFDITDAYNQLSQSLGDEDHREFLDGL